MIKGKKDFILLSTIFIVVLYIISFFIFNGFNTKSDNNMIINNPVVKNVESVLKNKECFENFTLVQYKESSTLNMHIKIKKDQNCTNNTEYYYGNEIVYLVDRITSNDSSSLFSKFGLKLEIELKGKVYNAIMYKETSTLIWKT